MRPRTLAILVTVLPLFTVNIAYLVSASNGLVAWCIPYIDGCTTISQAGRSENTIFLFRAAMTVHAVLLVLFWLYARQWIGLFGIHSTLSVNLMCWTGIVGAFFLILYVSFLGTSGEFQRFLRHYGIVIYFSFTPLAQLLKLRLLYQLKASTPELPVSNSALRYQLIILVLVLATGLLSLFLGYTGNKTYESENIIEWNFSLLLTLYFAGSVILWWHTRVEMFER